MITRLAIGGLRLAASALKRGSRRPEDLASVILVELTGLGDVISVLPAVQIFHSLFPSANLRLLVDNRFVELLLSLELPATVHGVAGSRSASGTMAAIQMARDMHPTLACSMSPPRRNALVALASGAPSVAGYLAYTDSLAPYLVETPVEMFGLEAVAEMKYGRQHISERALLVCRALGYRGNVPAMSLRIAEPAMVRVRADLLRDRMSLPAEYVVIHPFAGWKYREWPQKSFAELAERLVETHGQHVVFLWEKEKDGDVPFLRSRFAGCRSVHFASQLTLLESAVMVSGASLYIGNDSGPLHLAAGLGVPAVGLFGPAGPALTAPRSLSPISWIYHSIHCSPCDQRACVQPTHPCMDMITVEEVLAASLSIRRRPAHA